MLVTHSSYTRFLGSSVDSCNMQSLNSVAQEYCASQLIALAAAGAMMLDSLLGFVQNTFVTMFEGSPEKALRAVLMVMGVYVLTAAPLVAWVVYGLFQQNPKVSTESVWRRLVVSARKKLTS